tara:strand:- start:53 stop:295 length:243 start_codon:yes stop_codon:yes gene_type:complete
VKKVRKLTPQILKKIIQEERNKIEAQKKRIQESKERNKVEEIRKELKALLQLKREQKYLIERIKKIRNRTNNIKKKIKES